MALSDNQVETLLDSAKVEETHPGLWVSVAASDLKALCDEVIAARNPPSTSGGHALSGQGGGIDPTPTDPLNQ